MKTALLLLCTVATLQAAAQTVTDAQLKARYDSVQRLPNGLIKVKKGLNKILLDASGKEISKPFESFHVYPNGLVRASTYYQHVLLNQSGKEISDYYDEMSEHFEDDRLKVGKEKDHEGALGPIVVYGYINSRGKEVIKCQYLGARDFGAGVAAVQDVVVKSGHANNLYNGVYDGVKAPWTVIDKDGKAVIPKGRFSDYTRFNSLGRAWAYMTLDNGESGFGHVDKKGNIWIKPKYSSVEELGSAETVLVAVDAGLVNGIPTLEYGVMNAAGNPLIAVDYQEIKEYQGALRVRGKNGYGIYGKAGGQLVPPQYKQVGFSDGYWYVHTKEGKSGLYTASGKQQLPATYSYVEVFKEHIIVAINGKVGVMDLYGNLVVPIKYELAQPVGHDLYAIRQGKKWAFADRSGKELTDFRYDEIGGFSKEVAVVYLKGKKGLVNTELKEIVPTRYDKLFYPQDGMAMVVLNNKYGYVDINTGKETIPPIYSSGKDFSDGRARVVLNGETFEIDKNGNKLEIRLKKGLQ